MSVTPFPFVPYHPEHLSPEEILQRAQVFYQFMDRRRTVRDFSDKPVAKEVMEQLLLTASTAPSGAHKQPWTFCVVSDPALKKQIREAAEKEEFDSYNGRMTTEWLEDLAPLGTDWQKPFLETAPYLIVVFKKAYDLKEDGSKRNNYYVSESVGIACGFLIAAIHQAGLVTLTHTPSPMNFLTRLLNRPENERPFLLLPVGYPAAEVKVPDLKRKPLEEVTVWYGPKAEK
ncbi:nitroreductase family protein [Pontibacter diazotrophicus]|uniref:Nitroreductase family protein n=1 Tax=Pontibacter diazotrophicus TaxID=1400979 RepID=A0A3D8LGV1_9BACT|nr:nitroreductase family protein [Pontibacter diazotrophicus]RDV16464.1 nitroreductase family protein [Pontibacter diazotrophicus]